MSHQAERLELLEQAGCTEGELCRLANLVARWAPRGGSWAIGVVCNSLHDPTGRNWSTPDVVCAIVRDRRVTTFLLTRQPQFRRPDKGRGHFNVLHTRLRRM